MQNITTTEEWTEVGNKEREGTARGFTVLRNHLQLHAGGNFSQFK